MVEIKGFASSTTNEYGEFDVLISLNPPKVDTRQPTDIICVIDVSGSMDDEATVLNERGVKEKHGLSILDITKHSIRTIINVLGPDDRFGLVSYSSYAITDFSLAKMDEDGQQAATKACESLRTRGQTNIWAGLQHGLYIAKSSQEPNRICNILLLTDGKPNIDPPLGEGTEADMLREYKEEYKSLPCTVSTFGFGYGLDSKMLKDIAVVGGGSYAFIPDGGMVGTIFVNTASNLLLTFARDAELTLRPLQSEFSELNNGVVGDYEATKLKHGLGLHINLGTLQYGQSKDVVVRMKKLPAASEGELKAYLRAELVCVSRSSVTEMAKGMIKDREDSLDIVAHVHRLTTASMIQKYTDQLLTYRGNDAIEKVTNSIKTYVWYIKETMKKDFEDSNTASLVEDLEGQVLTAVSRVDYFLKWGKHYLPSLSMAHLHQQCNNFKDPGVQGYGGDLFLKLRDIAEEKFMRLPPATPSRFNYGVYGGSSYTSSHTSSYNPPVNMSAFYNAGGG